jgi:hypothetical protein
MNSRDQEAETIVPTSKTQPHCVEQDRCEALIGLRRGLDALARGETRPIEAVLDDLRMKYE